jgi:di/tricarboxylate transporter
MPELTLDMMLVMGTIAVVVFLFVVEWVRVDVVAILMMVALPLMNLITPKEAFVGLSSNAVVSIIAVIIIGAGLDKTGVINRLVAPILKVAGRSPSRIVIAISLTVAGISSFMQNIGAAALFLPAIQRISRDLEIPISKLLMPVGFSAILGGTITLVGSSPLILLNDLLVPYQLEPFGLFDVTPVGLALVAGGIASFIILGRFILPKGDGKESFGNVDKAAAASAEVGQAYELHTPGDFTHYREPVCVGDLRRRYLANVVAITEPPHFKVVSPGGDVVVRSGVDLVVFGLEKDIRRMAETEGMALKEQMVVFKNDVSKATAGTVEAVVAPRSPLAGKTLNEVRFEDRFRVVPMAISRHRQVYRSEIADMPLMVGDTLLLHGLWNRFLVLREEGSLLFNLPGNIELMRPEKAAVAVFWLVVALTMVIGFKLQLSVCLMAGALGMVVTRVLDIDEAYRAVDWRTVFLLGGLIPLGIATEKTGTASWIAHSVLQAIGTVSPIVLLTVIGLLATFFTLVISNVGATVLLVPLVVNMAIAADADPRMAALVVGLGTSNSFILPTHQVNALYMGPGRYRSVDFIKAGMVVSVVFLAVMIGMIALVYGV